jgi:DNA-binding transcriptional LysR family regulator
VNARYRQFQYLGATLINFRTLDLNLLRVFDVLMAEGSLTRAAEALAITQPAASHALKRLHGAIGEALFFRTASGMKPTPRAQALWPEVRAALGSLQHALAPDDFDPLTETTSFRLAMADATAALLAPPMVREVEALRARVNLRVLPLTTRDPRRLLRDGEADLAVGHFPQAIAAIVADAAQASLRHFRLHDTHYVCVMRREHPLAGQPLTLDAYCAAHHLLVSFSGRPHGLVDEALAALGRQRHIVLTVNQFFTAGQVVTQSDLLTVLPLSFIPATGTQDRVVTRMLPFDLAPVSVQMLWPVRQDADAAHRWLRALVKQAAGASS